MPRLTSLRCVGPSMSISRSVSGFRTRGFVGMGVSSSSTLLAESLLEIQTTSLVLSNTVEMTARNMLERRRKEMLIPPVGSLLSAIPNINMLVAELNLGRR